MILNTLSALSVTPSGIFNPTRSLRSLVHLPTSRGQRVYGRVLILYLYGVYAYG
jgi:hypothetical protein